MKTILGDFQKKTIALFKKTPLAKTFYLAGGTALSEFYFQHRKSEDLDFFSEKELSLPSLKKFAGSIQSRIPLDKVEFQSGFGLFTFFFYPKGEVAKYKIDFGQYPFNTIEKPRNVSGLLVESLYDIAVDKAHTISVRPRLRDFIDLYFIFQEREDWKFNRLVQKAQEKFEIVVDPLQLGENLTQVRSLQDMPIMIKSVDMKNVQHFFLKEAKKLETQILSR